MGPTDLLRAPHPDVGTTKLANSQWGVVTRQQLTAIGMTATMVRDRIRRGLLTRLHRGVYVVGHVTGIDGIPVTTVARTVVDIATVLSADRLASLLAEAERRMLLDMRDLERAIARTRTRRGPGHAAAVHAPRHH